jgi:hypothetical protein
MVTIRDVRLENSRDKRIFGLVVIFRTGRSSASGARTRTDTALLPVG